MSRVFVTGATGFIGRELIAHLIEQGCEIVAGSRRPAELFPRVAVEWADYDLSRPDILERGILAGVDCIFHLAARVHVMRRSSKDEEQFVALNVAGTEALAKQAAEAGVRRFIFLSSIKVNGERTVDRPFGVGDAPAPQDPYGCSKWQAEQALIKISQSTGLEVVIVRPPLVYGPGVQANFRRLLSLAYAGFPLPLAAVENSRSLIGVWNLVDWLWRARVDENLPGRAWLVSDGDDVSTPKLVRLMSSSMDRPVRMWRIPVSLLRRIGFATGRSGEVARLVDSLQVDITDTCSTMGWRPPVSIEEGIRRTAAWYLEYRRGHN